jgi:hypothetical protein
LNRIQITLILLVVIPAMLNFYTPLYNSVNPELGGMPFFYWFQIVLLAATSIPYLALKTPLTVCG